MKHCSLVVLILALSLLCSACGGQKAESKGEYTLYFAVSAQTGHGSALGIESYFGKNNSDPGDLMKVLLAGPTKDGLTSPFPRGVTLQKWEWDASEEGNVKIWLSEQYSGLADISLTLADYCIVLTLAQLDGVESVEIISEGHAANYRSHQLLLAEEAMLADGQAG